MVIDIDSFLEKYNQNNFEEKKDKKKEEVEVNLDFQTEIENKINEVKEKGLNSNLDVLKELFKKLENFDVDLPNKFLGIESKTATSLKELGLKYSKNYLDLLKKDSVYLLTNINSLIEDAEKDLENENFISVFENYKKIINLISKFPKDLTDEKLKVLRKINVFKIKIFEKIENYKKFKLDEIRKNLKLKLKKILLNLSEKDLEVLENELYDLIMYVNKIPKLFLTEMTADLVLSEKVILKCEETLSKKLEKSFEDIKSLILFKMNEFHKFYLRNDDKATIFIYDEIVNLFLKLPNIKLDEKVQLFSEINELYISINKLITMNQINYFMKSFNVSKYIADLRITINKIKNLGRINKNLYLELNEKINKIPEKYYLEKNELLNELDSINKVLFKSDVNFQNLEVNFSEKKDLKDTVNEFNKYLNFLDLFFKNYKNLDENKKKIYLYKFMNKLKNNNKLSELDKKIIVDKIKSFVKNDKKNKNKIYKTIRIKNEESFNLENEIKIYETKLKQIFNKSNKKNIKEEIQNLLNEINNNKNLNVKMKNKLINYIMSNYQKINKK